MKESSLIRYIFASAAIHVAAVGLFFSKPLYFNPTTLVALRKTPPTRLEEDELTILKKQLALEEAFQDLIVLPSQARVPHDIRHIAPLEDESAYLREKPLILSNVLAFPEASEIALANLAHQQLTLPAENFSASFVHLSLKLHPTKPTIQPLENDDNPFEALATQSFTNPPMPGAKIFLDFEFLPSQEKSSLPATALSTPTSPSSPANSTISFLTQPIPISEEPPPLTKHQLYSSPVTLERPRLTPQFALPPLTAYGIPDLSSVDWNEFFEVDVKTVPREEGGYLFSLTFLPKVDLSEHHLPQNYYFLIDRSNSIEKHRYQGFKRAVMRAIGSLREGDHFNVIIFDTKVAQLSENPLPYHKKNHRLAEDFLEKQPHGHYGAATDIYSSLSKIIPSNVNPSEVHTAILISDGDTTLKPDKQRKLIQAWLRENRGRVTLYTAAAGQGNNLAILDLLATAGRGSFIYSDTHTGFPRKLASLILSLRFPIAKEMTLSVSANPSSNLKLFPPSARLPHLFSDHPFTLYGSTDTLSDFFVTLEGQNQDKILSIKKTISFSQAKQGNRLLSKQWTAQQAQMCYEQYLQDGKIALLEEAKQLLSDDSSRSRR